MYLVDTNVISAGAPARLAPPELIVWMDEHSAALFLSAVTVAEIEDGIAKLRRERATRKNEDLKDWFETVLHLYGDRVLAFFVPVGVAGRFRRQRFARLWQDLAETESDLHKPTVQAELRLSAAYGGS